VSRKSDGAAKVTLVQRLVRVLLRQGWKKGVVGGNPAWTALGGVALIGYLAGRVLKRDPDVVFLEQIRPGESIRITHEAK
jgi:hypothetical protein